MEELLPELDVKFYCQRCGKETPHREKNLSKRAKRGTWEAYEYIGHSLARTEGFSEVDDGKVGKRAGGQTVQHLKCCTGWTLFFRWGRALESSQTWKWPGPPLLCPNRITKCCVCPYEWSSVPWRRMKTSLFKQRSARFILYFVWWKLVGIHAFPIEDIDKGGLSFRILLRSPLLGLSWARPDAVLSVKNWFLAISVFHLKSCM